MPSPVPGVGEAASDQVSANSVVGVGGRHKRLVMTLALPVTAGPLARAVASLTSAACPSVWHRSDDPPDDPPAERRAAQGVRPAADLPRACHSCRRRRAAARVVRPPGPGGTGSRALRWPTTAALRAPPAHLSPATLAPDPQR